MIDQESARRAMSEARRLDLSPLRAGRGYEWPPSCADE
jgi:hypothetical protein